MSKTSDTTREYAARTASKRLAQQVVEEHRRRIYDEAVTLARIALSIADRAHAHLPVGRSNVGSIACELEDLIERLRLAEGGNR